jgi:Protein of unknown function (DUF4004)
MENDLISKKELLEQTEISYGQLYRWKRKNLVPEDWFIRKSTFTGQETFFPKEKMLARIDKIKNMKDDLSLDDIADVFSPVNSDIKLTPEEVVTKNIISKSIFDAYSDRYQMPGNLSFEQILFLFIAQKLLESGDINLEEGKNLLATLDQCYATFEGKPCDIIIIRKLGVSVCFLLSSASELQFETATKVITRLNLQTCIEELRQKI